MNDTSIEMECETSIIPGKKGRLLFMQQPPLEFLPQGDPAQLSATQRDRILWTAAKRYMQGLITEEQYKYIERRYKIGSTKTISPRRIKNE